MNGIKTKNITILKPSPVRITSWQNGSNDDIVTMIKAADDGIIDIHNYWSVGDERIVHMSKITGGSDTAFPDDIPEQDISLVILDTQYWVNNDIGVQSGINFLIGTKTAINGTARMNSTNTNSGSYNSSLMKPALGKFRTVLPTYIRQISKSFTVSTASERDASTLQTATVYVALASAGEIGPKDGRIPTVEWDNTKIISYYAQGGRLSIGSGIWMRTPNRVDISSFMKYYPNQDNFGASVASYSESFVPIMCI